MAVSEPIPDIALPVAAGPAHGRWYVETGYAFAALGALFFSTKGIAIKLAYQEPVDATLLLALRMGLALPVYLIIGGVAMRDARHRGSGLPSAVQIAKAAAVGALGYWVASYLDFFGLEFISAQFERLILYTYPLFVVIFGAMFFGVPLRMKALAAIGVSYLGLTAIFLEKVDEPGSNVLAGATLVLGSAIAFALYQLVAKGLIAQLGPRLFTCIAMTGAAAAVFAQFLLTRPVAQLVAV